MRSNCQEKAASASASNDSAPGSVRKRETRSRITGRDFVTGDVTILIQYGAERWRLDTMPEAFPYSKKIEIDKPPRAKAPKQVAVIDQTGCTGCEACISFCPVDCIEIVPGPEFRDFMKLVEVDLERCIGCQLCARYCQIGRASCRDRV